MIICVTALYLDYTAQCELCTVQHARFVLATVVCTVAHSVTTPCTFYHGSSRYCHGEKLVPHKVLSVSIRSQSTFPPLSPELSSHRGRVIRPRQRPNWNSCLQCSDSMISDFIAHRYPSLILNSYGCSPRCKSTRIELER